MISREKLNELEIIHNAWVSKVGVSRGQREDSETILELIEEIERLRQETLETE